ncbi:MAG: hypothetical protein ACRYGG_21940 [Janthinobacterium lividum]
MPDSPDDITKIGGMRKGDIERADDEQKRQISDLRRDFTRVELCVFGNGKPGLEEKIMKLVQELLEHKMKTRSQAESNICFLITNEETYRKEHVKNEISRVEKDFEREIARLSERITDDVDDMNKDQLKLEDSVKSNGEKTVALDKTMAKYIGGLAVLIALMPPATAIILKLMFK